MTAKAKRQSYSSALNSLASTDQTQHLLTKHNRFLFYTFAIKYELMISVDEIKGQFIDGKDYTWLNRCSM